MRGERLFGAALNRSLDSLRGLCYGGAGGRLSGQENDGLAPTDTSRLDLKTPFQPCRP